MGDGIMNLEMGEMKNGTYFKQWREEMSATAKKRWRRFWAGFTLLWLAGALRAFDLPLGDGLLRWTRAGRAEDRATAVAAT